jgi:hypothetical protein
MNFSIQSIKPYTENYISPTINYRPDRRKFTRNLISFDTPLKHREIILSDPNLKLLPKGQILNRSREGLLCVFKKVEIIKSHRLQTPLGLFKVVWTSSYEINNKSFIKAGLEIINQDS